MLEQHYNVIYLIKNDLMVPPRSKHNLSIFYLLFMDLLYCFKKKNQGYEPLFVLIVQYAICVKQFTISYLS
jgi:hypothetical protein